MTMKLSVSDRKKAFRELFDRYYAPFCLYAKRFIDDEAEREDIVSDVFARLWADQDLLDLTSDTTLGYIKMCVKNSCLNYLKHQEYEWNYVEKMQKYAPIYDENYDSVFTLDELYHMLYDTLEKLPDDYREVFKQSFFAEKTQAEIAESMNLSVKTVGRYKQKVMEVLQQTFKDYLPVVLGAALLHH